MKKYIVVIGLISWALSAHSQPVARTFFDDVDVEVKSLKFNTIASDISPAFFKGDLYFSSVPEKYWNKPRLDKENRAFYETYSVKLDDKGNAVSSRQIVEGFENEYHEGPVAYCAATQELFVTLSNVSSPDTIPAFVSYEQIRLKLAIMKWKDGKWQIKEELPFNDRHFHFAHPAVSSTGDTLVFSSDIEGKGFGRSDLYMSVRKNGKWSGIVNLGNVINTPGNEMFPSFGPGGLLLFASDGHEGFGQLDIFYSTFPRVGKVTNMGDKINSAYDDFGLVIHSSGALGFFASNRPGFGSDDIYQADFKSKFHVFTGIVRDAQTMWPIPSASVQLLNCRNQLVTTAASDAKGYFEFVLPTGFCSTTGVAKEGYDLVWKNITGLDSAEFLLKSRCSYAIVVLDRETRLPIKGASVSQDGRQALQTSDLGLVQPLCPFGVASRFMINSPGYLDQTLSVAPMVSLSEVRRDTVLLFQKLMGKTFVLNNIYYDWDKWDILPESGIELDKLVNVLLDNPTLRVELGSHTDARGTDSYNAWLSQKRSDSAVGYLIEKGISPSRLVAKGYGETLLVNQCANGVVCPDVEHRKNRRTEFKIIGY